MPTIYRKSMTLKDFLSQNDRFAANSGCLLKEVREGYARAELVVTSEHLNAGGVCLLHLLKNQNQIVSKYGVKDLQPYKFFYEYQVF